MELKGYYPKKPRVSIEKLAIFGPINALEYKAISGYSKEPAGLGRARHRPSDLPGDPRHARDELCV